MMDISSTSKQFTSTSLTMYIKPQLLLYIKNTQMYYEYFSHELNVVCVCVCVMTYLPSSINIVRLGYVTAVPSNFNNPPTITNHTMCGPII